MLAELRTAARAERIAVLELDERCRWPRLRGRVVHVTATGALVTIVPTTGAGRGGPHDVPTECIRAWTLADYGRPAPDLRSVA